MKTRGAGVSHPSWILGGVNARGAGGGKPFTRGELGEENFKGVVLSSSLSGDSSPIWRSDLIL